jgi:protoporphyrinogen oxidase
VGVSRNAIVIGGGPAGIRAAQLLARGGARTTLLESAPVLGGLASSFDVQGTTIERYYHFICRGDDDLVEALDEIGLGSKLHWKSSRMAYFVDGKLLPFLTPLELLRFTPLSLVDRLRAGFAVKLAQQMKEEDLAPQRANAWLRRLFGERAFKVIWEPLMRFKFAEHADSISAAWIWARMVRLSRSRQSPWREDLGYVEGGSQAVIEGLRRDFERHGGTTRIAAPVEAILLRDGRVASVRVGGEDLPADVVVSTVTPGRLLQLAPDFPEGAYKDALRRIPVIGIFCLFLRLRHSLTPYFWVNANDPRVPFAGMIEYTNLNPLPELGGDHILYVPQYLSAEDPRYSQSDEQVLRDYCDALALVHPGFDRSWVKFHAVFRDRYAQPICLTDYRETTPGIETPVANLLLTDSSQLHPHDRTISGSMSLGRQAARRALEKLGPA